MKSNTTTVEITPFQELKSPKEGLKLIMPGEVRVRFAPSPTGAMHIGGARTAFFNYLFARKYHGIFVLRIEDTDVERSKPEYEEDIIDGLKWLGIEWQEGPAPISQREIGETPNSKATLRGVRPGGACSQIPKNKKYVGNYGPYRQSERVNIYRKYLEKLLNEGRAYYCFCLPQDLEAQRQEQMARGEPPQYSGKCADLPKETVQEYLAEGKPSVIRFRMPAKKVIFDDIVRGRVEFDARLLGDIVIAKSTSSPLYNFAAAVDDFEMKITHVIRGEDHLSNTPKQILIQEALDFPQPTWCHLPLILGPDKSKLSKRHGAVALSQYKEAGYLPEALINFIALLGWNPGTQREIFSMSSLIQEFSTHRIQKAGAVFNIRKLDWLQGFYVRQKSLTKLTELCLPYLIEAGFIEPFFKNEQYPPAYGAKIITQKFKVKETKEEISFDCLKSIVSLYQERLKKLSEVPELIDFFFKEKLDYPKELLKWKEMSEKEIKNALDKLKKTISRIEEKDWSKENIEKTLMAEAEKSGPEEKQTPYGTGDRGKLLWPLRVALTGRKASAGPFEISEILGKEKTLKRLKWARKKL